MKMAHYRLTSTAGVDLGTYEGMTLSDALDAMARKAGYDSNAHAIESAGPFEGIAECIEDGTEMRCGIGGIRA